MKKTIIESIDNDTTAVPSFRGAKFRSLIESILNDSDDSVEGFDELPQEADDDSFETADVEDADVEDTDDVDVEDADVEVEDDVDAEADAGSVTIEFTADEISLLRSILDKVDAASADEAEVEDDVEDDDFEAEDDFDVEDDDVEDDVEDDDDDAEFDDEETEEEEEDFFDEDEEYVAEENESTTAPRRVQKTPAVNRSGKATAPVIDSAVAAGKAGEAADTKGAPKRTKFNGEVKRGKTKHEGDRYAEGEVMVKIGK